MATKFQPSSTATLSEAELIALIEEAISDVPDFVNDLGWEWDADALTYAGVDPDEIESALEDLQTEYTSRAATYTDQFLDGSINTKAWQKEAGLIILLLLLGSYSFGMGGAKNDADWNPGRDDAIDQMKLFDRFGKAIVAGNLSGNQISSRTGMYLGTAILSYHAGRDYIHQPDSFGFEENILGLSEVHCPECPDQTALGIVPRGTLIRIGARICRSGCRCRIQYHRSRSGSTTNNKMMPAWGFIGTLKHSLITPISYCK